MAERGFQGAFVAPRLPKRDRAIVLAALMATATLAWAYLLSMRWGMAHMGAMVLMPGMTAWSVAEFLAVLAMWAVMMAAMMLPSIVPMVLIFASLCRNRHAHSPPYLHTSVFVLGYLVIWSGFSLLATLAQWGLLEARLVTPMTVRATPLLAGGLLVVAGLFQVTPLKHACLGKCASPLGFLLTEWRDGTGGAWIMGLRHGAYCVGCCWLLMTLLFVFGVMNVLWIAALSLYVLLEKLLPQTRWLAFAQGAVLVGWGVAVATAV